MRLSGKSAQDFRNQQIVELDASGYNQVQISKMLSCSQAWVSKILRRYEKDGQSGILSGQNQKGLKQRISQEQLTQLEEFLLEGALHHGFATDNWTRERIAELIKQKFNISYHPSHISRIMKQIGFSLQKPITKSYKQDKKAVAKWKNETLPALKKSD